MVRPTRPATRSGRAGLWEPPSTSRHTLLQARPADHTVCASKEPRGVLAFGGHIPWCGLWALGQQGQGHNAPLRPPWLDAGSGLHSTLALTRGGKPVARGPWVSGRLRSPGRAGCSRHCPLPLQENLRQFVDRVFRVITKSGVSCPTVMCDIFFSLREAAAKRFQGECSWAPCGEASRPQRTHRSHQG